MEIAIRRWSSSAPINRRSSKRRRSRRHCVERKMLRRRKERQQRRKGKEKRSALCGRPIFRVVIPAVWELEHDSRMALEARGGSGNPAANRDGRGIDWKMRNWSTLNSSIHSKYCRFVIGCILDCTYVKLMTVMFIGRVDCAFFLFSLHFVAVCTLIISFRSKRQTIRLYRVMQRYRSLCHLQEIFLDDYTPR